MPLEWPERARCELVEPASQLILTSEVDEAKAAPVGDRGAANVNIGDQIVVVDLQAVMVFSPASLLGAGSAAYLYPADAAGFGSVGTMP